MTGLGGTPHSLEKGEIKRKDWVKKIEGGGGGKYARVTSDKLPRYWR